MYPEILNILLVKINKKNRAQLRALLFSWF